MDQGPEHDLRIDHPPTTLRELAVERLRDSIITGRFHGGDRLVERTLCDQLGVSRSVVREAIRYLEAEGLVEIPARSGPVVATLDWPRARQIYDIRRLLEAKAAGESVNCKTCHTLHGTPQVQRAKCVGCHEKVAAVFRPPPGNEQHTPG